MITGAKWQDVAETRADLTFDTGKVVSGVHVSSWYWLGLQDWIVLGNTPDPADPPPGPDKASPLTNKELEELIVSEGVIPSAAITAKKNAR